jgi:transposase
MVRDGQESSFGGEIHDGRGTSLHPRLAWMMCYDETHSAQEVCRRFGISRKTFYKWLKRYRQSGENAGSLSDMSRRPHRFPRATPESSVQLLKRLKDQTGYGQRRLKTYLQEKYNISLSERTIWKILKRLDEAEKEMLKAPSMGTQSNVIFSSGV